MFCYAEPLAVEEGPSLDRQLKPGMKDSWLWLVALGLSVLCCAAAALYGNQHFFCLVKINYFFRLV